MKLQSILIAVMAAALVVPAWAQQPAAAGGSADAQAAAVRAALVPLILPQAVRSANAVRAQATRPKK